LAAAGLVGIVAYRAARFFQHFYHAKAHVGVQLVNKTGYKNLNGHAENKGG
jgi:hypothetical protein